MSVPATLFLGGLQTLNVDLLSVGSPTYGIFTSGSGASSGLLGAIGSAGQIGSQVPVITPDSVLSFEYRGEERISDYPVEQGGFASYNKVRVPADLRTVMTCSGLNYLQSALQGVTQNLSSSLLSSIGVAYGQPMQRSDFLNALEAMLKSTSVYDIVTPDEVYSGYNLVSYGYVKKNNDGAVMIIAELAFKEVRTTVAANYSSSGNISSNSASAYSPVSTGTQTFALGTNPATSIGAFGHTN